MYVLLAGLNHPDSSGGGAGEVFHLRAELVQAYQELKNHADLEASVILSTCNRTEVYATAKDIQKGFEALKPS